MLVITVKNKIVPVKKLNKYNRNSLKNCVNNNICRRNQICTEGLAKINFT